MKLQLACLAALSVLVTSAHAVVPVYVTHDHSSATVLDKASAQAILKDGMADKLARLARLYPTRRWGFLSEVEGGFNASKTCVITARVLMLPVSGTSLIYRPNKTATTFDALPGATREQCRDLAKAKLREAVQSMLFSLLPS